MKYIYIILLFVYAKHLTAQAPFLVKKADSIDSLIYYSNYEAAEKQTDKLYELLSTGYTQRKYIDLKLRVMLQKIYLYLRNQKNTNAIKTSLDIIDQAKAYNLPEKEYMAYLIAAEAYETTNYYDLCKENLDKAYLLHKKNNLDSIYSIYCVRYSSYCRFVNKNDSAIYFAYQALDFAQKYNNKREYLDASLLLGMLVQDYQKAVKFTLLAAAIYLEKNDYLSAATMYSNVANTYCNNNIIDTAFIYIDTASYYAATCSNDELIDINFIYQTKTKLFDKIGNIDSAYFYFKKYHFAFIAFLEKQEILEVKNITEKYENDKKEAAIQSKNQQIIFIIALLIVILIAIIFLITKNRKINTQNKVISKQVEQLIKTLAQKQVLLSELQHRVKNNLQHVISILEIQKESINFNNLDEVIRGNQNRIYSMALLHKKLNVDDNVNEVNLQKYMAELAELVKNSYHNADKKISLHVDCEIEKMSIHKALPLGLIIVELVSNSMKHAFKNKNNGIINIILRQEKQAELNTLYYADNGTGFDFDNNSSKGLGLEIIKGLIDQLDAATESHQHKGFELRLQFK